MYTAVYIMVQSTPNPGSFCAELGITTTMLLDETAAAPLSSVPVIKNGLVLELYAVLKSYNLKWASSSNWIDKLYPGGTRADTWALRKSIVALNSRYAYLKKKNTKTESQSGKAT